jgi:hypothetical protein
LSAALLIAADASDAATICGVLAFAMAIGERALAALNAVVGAVAAAAAIAQHPAKVLQGGGGKFVLTFAMDLESARALFKLQFATGHNAPVASRRTGGRKTRCLPRLRLSAHRRGT